MGVLRRLWARLAGADELPELPQLPTMEEPEAEAPRAPADVEAGKRLLAKLRERGLGVVLLDGDATLRLFPRRRVRHGEAGVVRRNARALRAALQVERDWYDIPVE